jgi:hypothetical protein
MNKGCNSISKIVLEYFLKEVDDSLIDWILRNELDKDEKEQILLCLNDERVKQILRNLGIDEKFIESI